MELRADESACRLLPHAKAASEGDWSREYLDYIMGVKIVNSIDDAIDHIERYSSHHSDCIVTSDQAAADRFLASVDSAAVYHNASTRFTDGGELGLGQRSAFPPRNSTPEAHGCKPACLLQICDFRQWAN